jgi:catechol 2,3-dioxygenase-like lactoylglutathione lyase family enzyme
MFSHLYIGLSDFDRAIGFYRPLAAAIGLHERFCEADPGWAGWHRSGSIHPLLIVGRPWNGQPHDPGNGQMTAFLVEQRAKVRELHALALTHGGVCEGPPGLRPHYHHNYYGAYFRDTEGNKLCVVCDGPVEVAGE